MTSRLGLFIEKQHTNIRPVHVKRLGKSLEQIGAQTASSATNTRISSGATMANWEIYGHHSPILRPPQHPPPAGCERMHLGGGGRRSDDYASAFVSSGFVCHHSLTLGRLHHNVYANVHGAVTGNDKTNPSTIMGNQRRMAHGTKMRKDNFRWLRLNWDRNHHCRVRRVHGITSCLAAMAD